MFTFIVTPDVGERYEIVADSRDISNWEKTGRSRSLGGLMRDMKASELESIAYFAAQRNGLQVGTFKEFAASGGLRVKDEAPDREQLVRVLERAIDANDGIPNSDYIADAVLYWLEADKEMDPTQPGQ